MKENYSSVEQQILMRRLNEIFLTYKDNLPLDVKTLDDFKRYLKENKGEIKEKTVKDTIVSWISNHEDYYCAQYDGTSIVINKNYDLVVSLKSGPDIKNFVIPKGDWILHQSLEWETLFTVEEELYNG